MDLQTLMKLLSAGALAPLTLPAAAATAVSGGGQAAAAPMPAPVAAPVAPVQAPQPIESAPPPQAPDAQPTVFPPAPPPAAAAAPAMHQGILGRLLGLDPSTSQAVRAIGAGMGNLRGNPYGDPFITAAQGFGGAQEYLAGQDTADQASATAAGNTAYERSKDAAEMELRKQAEARQQKSADLADQKTALEIRRDARQNGVSVTQMLEIERIAQAAGEGLFGEARTKAIDEERQRLIDQVQSGSGLTGRTEGLSTGDAPTATGPNGEKVILKDGAWVPIGG